MLKEGASAEPPQKLCTVLPTQGCLAEENRLENVSRGIGIHWPKLVPTSVGSDGGTAGIQQGHLYVLAGCSSLQTRIMFPKGFSQSSEQEHSEVCTRRCHFKLAV